MLYEVITPVECEHHSFPRMAVDITRQSKGMDSAPGKIGVRKRAKDQYFFLHTGFDHFYGMKIANFYFETGIPAYGRSIRCVLAV